MGIIRGPSEKLDHAYDLACEAIRSNGATKGHKTRAEQELEKANRKHVQSWSWMVGNMPMYPPGLEPVACWESPQCGWVDAAGSAHSSEDWYSWPWATGAWAAPHATEQAAAEPDSELQPSGSLMTYQ